MLPVNVRNYFPRFDPMQIADRAIVVIAVIVCVVEKIFNGIRNLYRFFFPSNTLQIPRTPRVITPTPPNRVTEPSEYSERLRKNELERLENFANKVNEKKEPLNSYESFFIDFEKLGSYLTHVRLDGSHDKMTIKEKYFFALKNAVFLEELILSNWSGKSGLSLFLYELCNLKSFKIKNCPNYNEALPQGLVSLQNFTISYCESYNQPFPEYCNYLSRLRLKCLLALNHPLPTKLDRLTHFTFTGCISYEHAIPQKFPPIGSNNQLDALVHIYLKDRGIAYRLTEKMGLKEFDLLQHLFKSDKQDESDRIGQILQDFPQFTLWRAMQRNDLPFVNEAYLEKDPLQRLYIYMIYSKIDPDSKNYEEQMPIITVFLDRVSMTPMDWDLQLLYEAMIKSEIDPLIDVIKWVDDDLEVERTVRILPYLLSQNSNRKMVMINMINLEQSGLFYVFQTMFPPDCKEAKDLVLPRLFTGNKAVDTEICYQKIANKTAQEKLNIFSLLTVISEDNLYQLAPYLTYCNIDDREYELAVTVKDRLEDFIGTFLERTKQLRYLRISLENFTGAAFAQFENVEQLRALEVANGSKLSYPLPENMFRLRSLVLRDCMIFNHNFRLSHSLTYLEVVGCDMFGLQTLFNSIMPLFSEHGGETLKFEVKYAGITFTSDNLPRFAIFWRNGKQADIRICYYVLSCLIADNKIPIDQLNFNREELLSLAPYLKYLEVSFDSDESFIGEILEKTTKLKHLVLRYTNLTGEFLSKFKKLDRLLEFTVEGCPDFNAPLPEGMTAIQKLSITHCERFNQPLPLDMQNLTSIKVEECPAWKKRYRMNYVFMIYHIGKERALKLARSLKVKKSLGLYISFYEAADENMIITSLKELITKRVDFPPKGLKKIEGFLKRMSGKTFLKNHINVVLGSPQLDEIVFSIYPPNKFKNFSLYNSIELKKEKMYLTLLPKMAVDFPALVFKAIKQIILGAQVKSLDVMFRGSRAFDAGGLSRQLIGQLIQGLLDKSKSKIFNFMKTEDGKVIPQVPSNLTEKDLDNYRAFGIILGIAFRRKIPTGEVFSEKWLHCIHSFTDDDLNGSITDFIDRMDNISLVTFMADCTVQNEELFEGCKTVLLAEESDTVIEAATTLNESWGDDALEQLIKAGDIEEVRKNLRTIWVADFICYLTIAQEMVRGMRQTLSLGTLDEGHTLWFELHWMTTEEFSERLQGRLTVDWIKQNIRIDQEHAEKALEIQTWLFGWLDEHRENRQALVNFVQALTGGSALAQPITFWLSQAVESLHSHTCSFTVDVSLNITKEIFLAILDGYGRGDDFDFTTT